MTRSQRHYPQIQHHGAVTGVTGSCHRYLASEHHHLLIDCGLFQGRDAELKADQFEDYVDKHKVDDDAVDPVQAIEFDLSAVKALIVTHVHIDHIGRLPYLIAAGFDGPIYCSKPTAHLLPLVIEDALKVGFTRNRRLISQFLARVSKQLVPLDYGVWESLDHAEEHLALRLQPAGHILGSAYVELALGNPDDGDLDVSSPYVSNQDDRQGCHRTVFSGDLGAEHSPLLPAPQPPACCHTLVIESTYGNRQHEDREYRLQRLYAVLNRALANGGTVMIPAFSIGRTQELLYELESLINATDDPAIARLQIIVDSPLAARFTQSYRELKPYWDAEARERINQGRHPLSFDNLYTIDSHEEHLQTVDYLARNRQPAVVLAASGMASGGRIVNYLKAMLPDPVHDVLFVGYQAQGTPGRALQEMAQQQSGNDEEGGFGDDNHRDAPAATLELDGEHIAVRAAIHTLGGYSAHADQQDLLRFVSGIEGLEEVRIVHGDDDAKRSLQRELMAQLAARNNMVTAPSALKSEAKTKRNAGEGQGGANKKAVKVWIPGLGNDC